MKRFRFPLEKVLRLREQETEQARRALGLAVAAEEAARQALQAAHELLIERTEEARAREAAGLSPFAFGSLRAHLTFLHKERLAREAELADRLTETARRRKAVIECRRREKALQRLREKRLEQWLQESLKEEQRDLDEHASLALTERPVDPTT